VLPQISILVFCYIKQTFCYNTVELT
jgi:hypothetical protein